MKFSRRTWADAHMNAQILSRKHKTSVSQDKQKPNDRWVNSLILS